MAEPLLNPDPDAPALVGGEYGAPAFQSVEGASGERTVENVPRATMVQPAPLPSDFGVFHDLVPQERPQVGGVDFGVFSDLIPKPPPSLTPASDAVVAATGQIYGSSGPTTAEAVGMEKQFQAAHPTLYGVARGVAGMIPTPEQVMQAGEEVNKASEHPIASLAALPGEIVNNATEMGKAARGDYGPEAQAQTITGAVLTAAPLLHLPFAKGVDLAREAPPTGPRAVEPAAAMRPPPETPAAAEQPPTVAEPAPKITDQKFNPETKTWEPKTDRDYWFDASELRQSVINGLSRLGVDVSKTDLPSHEQFTNGKDYFYAMRDAEMKMRQSGAKVAGFVLNPENRPSVVAAAPTAEVPPTEALPAPPEPAPAAPAGEAKAGWYHGSHENLSEFSAREVKSLDSLGTWLTSTPEHAKKLYGPNVHQSELSPDTRLLEFDGTDKTQSDMKRTLGANAQLAEEAGFAKEADILRQIPPDTPRLGELKRKLNDSGLTAAENIELQQLQKADVAAGTLLRSPKYSQLLRQMLRDAGYDGIVWRNSRIDARMTDAPHDVAVIFHEKPIKATGAGISGGGIESGAPQISQAETGTVQPIGRIGETRSQPDLGRTPSGRRVAVPRAEVPAERGGLAPPAPAGEAKAVVMSAMMDKNGKVYTGRYHSGIVDELATQIGHEAVNELKPFKPGFIDAEGNFLNREQAFEAAKTHGQIDLGKEKRLQEEFNLPAVERENKVWAEEIHKPGTFPIPPRVAEPPQGGEKVSNLQTAYDKAAKDLEAIGPEPHKPSPEKRFFGTRGREASKPEVVSRYDTEVQNYNRWRRQYSKLKKAEVEASNELFRAKREAAGEAQYMHPSERPEVPKITEVPVAEAAPAITPERALLDSLSGGKAAPLKERVSDAAKGIIEAAKQHVQSSQRQGLLPPGSEHIQNAIEGAQGVIRQIRGVPKFGDFQRGLNKFGSLMQRTNLTANELATSIRKQVPKKLQREAVFTYMDAGGDQAKLAAWAADPKAGPEYKAALKLTPQQKALADSLTKFFDQKGTQGQAAGVLKDLRSDYINRVVDTRKTQKAGGNPNTVPLPGGRLSKSFKFAQQRFHDYAYDAERNGVKYLTKDPAELIPIYLGEMNKTIGTKDFITSLTEGKASDSRPLAYPQGMGRRIMTPEGEVQARLIKPDFRGRVLDELTGEDVSSQDYQTLNHPALTKYKWVDTAEGKPVMVQGDLALHPEIAQHVKNILGTSAIRKWYRSPGTAIAAIPKAIVRTVDQVNQTAKQFLFSGSGFHHVTMGKKGFDVGARPIKNFFESLPAKAAIKADDPRVIFWSEHGSQLAPDRVSAGQFMEGFGGRTVERIPIYGKYVKTLSNHLFERFIPAMKLTLNEKYYAKNTKLFAKELARNEVSPDQLAYLSARQANEAMSHINYMDIGRNPTLQHIFSLGEIAPDFLESRTRFTARALGGLTGAKANRLALRGFVWGLAHTWVAARILNQLIDGDPHNDEPFGVVHNGRVYSMRTVYGDALHLLGGVYHATKGDISGLSQFTQARESALARAAQMLLTGVNYRGEKADGAEAAREFIATFVPIWAKGMPGLRNLTKSSSNNPVPPIEQFMGAWGMHSRRYSPITQTYQMASEYKTAQGIPKDVGVYPTSKYQQLRYALEDDDQEKAKAEFEKLLQGQPDRKKVLSGFHESLMHPFTESKAMDKKFRDSLEEGDRKVYDAASERRKEIMRRFNEMKAR